MASVIEQYLQKYAEKDTAPALAVLPLDRMDFGVTLPLLDEESALPDCLQALEAAARFAQAKVLVALVVNAPFSHPGNTRMLQSRGALGRAFFVQTQGNLVLWWMDRNSAGREFPPRAGVGLARKLGTDCLLAAWQAGKIASDFFGTTDADARVPVDYFIPPSPAPKTMGLGNQKGGYYHRYAHETQNNPGLAYYDGWLRYYHAGLEWAGSPYAFPTIGSLLRFHAGTYAQVRGFPPQEAAEDFYFLDKIAKIARVQEISSTVTLLGRESKRTPFGTGRRSRQITEQLSQGEPFTMYHPEIFSHLREWLQAVQATPRKSSAGLLPSCSPLTQQVLRRAGAEAAIATASRTRADDTGFRRHLFTWFDGLKTVQFVKAVQAAAYPPLPYEEAWCLSGFAGKPDGAGKKPPEITGEIGS